MLLSSILGSRLCYEDAGMATLDGGVEEKGDGGDGGDELRREARRTPAVKCIKICEGDDGAVVVAASIEGFKGILSYSFDASTKCLELQQKIEVGSPLWDLGFDSKANLWVLESEEPFFSVFCRKEGKFIRNPFALCAESTQVKQMLEGMLHLNNMAL